jgi:hypothetical protein
MVEKIATEIFAAAHARSCYRIYVFSAGFSGQLYLQFWILNWSTRMLTDDTVHTENVVRPVLKVAYQDCSSADSDSASSLVAQYVSLSLSLSLSEHTKQARECKVIDSCCLLLPGVLNLGKVLVPKKSICYPMNVARFCSI